LTSACSTQPIEKIVVRKELIEKPAPIIPSIEPVNLKPVQWKVITDKNSDTVFAEIRNTGKDPVVFALTKDQYENISYNLNDLRSYIAKQQEVINTYRRSYK